MDPVHLDISGVFLSVRAEQVTETGRDEEGRCIFRNVAILSNFKNFNRK
jgi:hypothetical protein